MSDFDYGPLRDYELVWSNGHTETVKAHQVTMPRPDLSGMFGGPVTKTHEYITFHGEIEGKWRLVLAAKPEDIRSIRDKATEEVL